MNIAVFGATGGTGREVVTQALEQGHRVTAFVRTPSKLGVQNAALHVVQGDAMNPSAVEETVKGQDAVISALGVSRGAPLTICSQGTMNIISAMKYANVRRLVVESAYGTGETKRGLYGNGVWMLIPSRIKDKGVMEKIVSETPLDWVISRPVRLTNGPRTGVYRSGFAISVGLFPKISRADTAEFMLKPTTRIYMEDQRSHIRLDGHRVLAEGSNRPFGVRQGSMGRLRHVILILSRNVPNSIWDSSKS